MKKILIVAYIIAIVSIIGLFANKAHSETYLAPPSVQQLITFYATKYNVSESVMRTVVSCESSYKKEAIGDKGKSFGLVQINLPSHPYVSKEQAFDPDFSLEFLAKNIAKGKGKMWTCWRRHYG